MVPKRILLISLTMNVSRLIPATLNELSMAEAFRFYRDDLNWQVYPVDGPWSDKSDPGKKPSVRAWWEYDSRDCDLVHYFSPRRCHNIGFAPSGKIIMIDLDSKKDEGESVYRFLAEHPKLANVPRHRTRGGAHLVFYCQDLPQWRKANGSAFQDPLEAQITDLVTAEFFHSNHSNVIVPPSIHSSLFVYRWEVFGEILEVSWKWIQEIFGFVDPHAKKKPEKKTPFPDNYKGDLRHLDLLELLQTLGHPAKLSNAEDGKYVILCPWHTNHSTEGEPTALEDTSTVIWQHSPGEARPAFKCLHAHCSEKGLEELLAWAESQQEGIVDRFCSQSRIYEPGQIEAGRPRILHPSNRLDTEVHTDIGKVIGAKHSWFVRAANTVLIQNVKTGYLYSDNPDTQYTAEAYAVGLPELSGIKARSHLEHYIIPGIIVNDSLGFPEFVRKSFSVGFCSSMVVSDHLQAELPYISRILTVPFPFRKKDKLLYPNKGYDRRFGTFMVADAPVISPMPIEKAIDVIGRLHKEFCFTTEQSKTHAVARLVTPFARGILGSTTRVPLWFYCANRPRAGKDYLSGVALIVYEGIAFEDTPIGKDQEETAKRIVSAARNARRFMHFSNCQVFLQDQYLTQALTNRIINARRLGSNEASSDLSIPNEMEYSISANVGLTYREDLEPRMRKIELAFYEEDANSRRFNRPFLHQEVKDNRSVILSAINALFHNWEIPGFPIGTTPFSSYPEWAQVVGGVMQCNGLGDPCLPFKSAFDLGGDRKTEAMSALFRVCYREYGDTWIAKKNVYQAVHDASQETNESDADDALSWFGPIEDNDRARSNQTKLGLLLREFNGRILGGVRLSIDTSSPRTERYRYRFTKLDEGGPPPRLPESVSKTTENLENQGQTPKKVVTLETSATSTGQLDTGDFISNLLPLTGREADIATPPGPYNVANVANVSTLALDIETYSETAKGDALSPFEAEIRLVSLSTADGDIELRDLKEGPAPSALLEMFETAEFIIHNAAFELRFLAVKFEAIPKKIFCTYTADKLLSPARTVRHDLGSVLKRHLDIQIPKELGASDWGGMLLTEEQLAYARNDVRYLHQLRGRLLEQLEAQGLTKIFRLESDLLPIIARMESHGFAVNVQKMREIRTQADRNATILASELRRDFDEAGLNLSSPQQLVDAFKEAGVNLHDTSEQNLCALGDPRAKKILAWRAETKLSASIKTLLRAERSGRIHATFNPMGTVTGRFSSRQPNLQNVTRGELRSCFVPSAPDRRLIVADYSQIELRVAAFVADEKAMIDAFKRGEDLHR
jgi:DNA polymerase family A/3'-5' exonuclease/Bifunctional DNA primase/polymerase, N-terminal